MIDARVCNAITPVTTDTADLFSLDIQGYFAPDQDGANGVIRWIGNTNEMIDGNPAVYQIAFYSGIDDPLTGTFDLTQGNQANYETCSVCVRVLTYDDTGTIVKRFYQNGGSLTLNQNPFTTKTLDATITNLSLEEVTIDSSAHSDPVPGGTCLTYNGASWMHDFVPNAWTCQHGQYGSGGNCTCNCGIQDPDCEVDHTLEGCTTGNACWDGACVTAPTNDTCQTAGTALTLGTAVTGTTAGAKHNYNKDLDVCTGNAPDYDQSGPDVAYQVALTQGVSYTVALTGVAMDADLGVSLVGPGAATICDANPIATCVKGADQMGGGGSETFQYTPATTGTYFVIVDSFDPSVGGAFTLTVSTP
jgi:hypothetical protein